MTHDMLTRTLIFVSLMLAVSPPLIAQDVKLPEVRKSRQLDGLYQNHPNLVAITGAMVTRFPGDEPSLETIFIRGKKIEAIGADLKIPAGTRTVAGDGLHIVSALIDAYQEIEIPFEKDQGTSYWNDQVRPQLRVAESFQTEALKAARNRKRGIAAALYAPKDGVIKGQSSLLLMLDDEAHPEDLVLKDSFAQHFHLTVSRGRNGYPNSPMGAVALARQAMYDAKWYHSLPETLEENRSLRAMRPMVRHLNESGMTPEHLKAPVVFQTSNELFCLRADRFAREFELENAILLGSGHEYRRLNAIAETKRPIILPVNFPKPPEVGSPEKAADVSLESLMHWEHAPKNPAALLKTGITFCFTAHGLKEDDDFLEKVRIAIKHGLSKEDALAALTTSSAKLLGEEKTLGKIEPGFLANLVITDKPIFDDDAKVLETWVAGKQFKIEESESAAVIWKVDTDSSTFNTTKLQVGKDIAMLKDADTSVKLKHASASDSAISGSFQSDKFGTEGWAQLSITLISEDLGSGEIAMPDGTTIPIRIAKTDDKPKTSEKADADKDDSAKPKVDNVATVSKVNYPFGYAGVESAPSNPGSVLIKNVTLWTCADDGVLQEASILVADGRIKSIIKSGEDLPAADVTIDGAGGHLTPGIIDCHSHMASDSGINESGQAITAEVRIGDMIDCDDITIYRQLAGGVTTANILHGSANPIGGQNQVIKLRWGALDEALKFKGAPAGIKFALGENVKQSNWDNPTNRYPQTRMGVEQLFDNAFEEAKLYRAKQKAGGPTRVNLELEAIAEIVEGKRWIHCHSYRQDEILALIRLLDRHKIQIGTFQHILEGYKVADEMAKHGAMGSAFSDWWAYKYEVKDAIPHAGALMHRQGVVMSFNSDDSELARHLNKEAAKAVRYGGLSYEEALDFVTINPAKQLRIDDRVGSIEVGKDADFVLWNAHPLSNLAIAEQTWIDGRKYFDRQEDSQRHDEFVKLKQQLIQKVLRSGEEMESGNAESSDPAKLWPRYDAFCGHSHHIHGHDHDDHHHEGHDHE